MSSDRLSFNQSANSEDDGARWEAYLELLKRSGASPSPSQTDAAAPEIIEAESLAGFESAGDDPTVGEPEALAAPDPDLGPLDNLYSPGPAAGSRHRGPLLIAAAAALVAVIAIGALLVPRQHAPRNTIAPTRTPAIAAAAHISPPVAAPPVSATPAVSSAAQANEALASSVPPARSHRQASSVRRLAQAAAEPARPATPQCWSPVPSLDAQHHETHLTDCVHFVPPVGPWRPTPEQ